MTPCLTGLLITEGTVFNGYLINGMLPPAMASTSLEITRVELYFENHQDEITIEKNFLKLKAYALVQSTGSGLLQGYWMVDNQILSQISQHVTADETIILETPEVPPLPTFNPGTHQVRFEITSPSTTIPLPKALYFVTSAESRGASMNIVLKSPTKNSINKYQALTFEWEALNESQIYLIEFYNRKKGASPIFSANTRKSAYTLDDRRLSKICQIGTTYYWKVKGFDKRKTIIGESDLWRFSFKK